MRQVDDIRDLVGMIRNSKNSEGFYAEDDADYMRGLLEAIISNDY